MKNFLILLLCAIPSLTIAMPCLAAEPESMILTYDENQHRLSVEVYHHTDERYRHYINSYVVTVNGGPEQRFFQQGQTSSAVTLKDMRVLAETGDTLMVTATCTAGDRIGGELILTETYQLDRDGWYKTVIEEKDRPRPRARDMSVDVYGHPYTRHRRPDRSHHGHKSHDPTEEEESEAVQPRMEQDRAQQHRQQVENEINRRSYEAKFGPLKTPEGSGRGD